MHAHLDGSTRLLTRSDVERLLDGPACIGAVESAFRMSGEGLPVRTGVLGLAAEAGGFHVKAAMLSTEHGRFAAKVNANFPGNPAHHGLPTIQGALLLFDTVTGRLLAVMDSIAITVLRTAAATAIAARYLAAPDATTVTVAGCGAQARAQLAMLQHVRPIERAYVFDLDAAKARAFAADASRALGIPVTETSDLRRATLESQIIVTCTTSSRPFLSAQHVSPGTFIGAVGADNSGKSEIEPQLMAASVVVTDSSEQCATMGDLHHAIAAGLMTREHVRAELGDVVADPARGRRDPAEIVIFDSTGVGFQDVAAAAVVYDRAVLENAGTALDFGS